MRRVVPLSLISFFALAFSASADDSHQYYEVRSYVLGEKGDAESIHEYLSQALLPALERQKIDPVGVFKNSAADETGSPRIIVVIPLSSADELAIIKRKLDADARYLGDSKAFFDRDRKDAPYQRIESELLISMDCMRQLDVPEDSLDNMDRVYELRIYESANQRLGDLKVDMFNNGEVPIFLDCGIQPIFIGQALVGPYTPNLTYLTMYGDEEARNEAWKAFRTHPDWNELKVVPKYKGTVSRIHKYVLIPTEYSQM